jgi:hypothetical protein
MPGFLSFEGEIRGGRQFLSGPAISDAPALSPSDTCGLDYQCRPETRRFPLPPLAPVSRVDFQFAPTESIKVIRPHIFTPSRKTAPGELDAILFREQSFAGGVRGRIPQTVEPFSAIAKRQPAATAADREKMLSEPMVSLSRRLVNRGENLVARCGITFVAIEPEK